MSDSLLSTTFDAWYLSVFGTRELDPDHRADNFRAFAAGWNKCLKEDEKFRSFQEFRPDLTHPQPDSNCRCRSCLTARGAIKTVSLTGEDLTTIPLNKEFVGMIICQKCGNKRCPHATDHNLECTRSNLPGQVGSIY